MSIDINLRQNQLKTLHNYLKDVDTEVTMILQNLQWDRKHLAEDKPMVACQYNKGHRVPLNKLVEHENSCLLKNEGYFAQDCLLPSPVDPEASTLVKLSGDNIAEIIKNASSCQPSFDLGAGCSGQQPLTLERLQATYTADERRAIHDAVVSRVPSCHDLSDLALQSYKDESGKESKAKSKLEILAELRDMRRRRTKYRVAAKTRNYSDVLRDVITTQMDLYSQASNSVAQNSITKNSDPEDGSKAKHSATEKYAPEHFDSTPSRKRQGSTSNSDGHNRSRYPKLYEQRESRARRHNESDRIDNSTSGTSKNDYGHYSSKSKRRNYEYYHEKANRESHRHDYRYDSRNKYSEKEYERKAISQTARENNSRIKDQVKDNHYVESKYEERHRSKDRHSNRAKKEHTKQEITKLSPKSRDATEGKKLYESRREQVHVVKIKKEKDGCYDDDSYTSEDNVTEYMDTISHGNETYSAVTRIKVEKDPHLKRVESTVEDDRHDYEKDWGSKSSDKHFDSSTYKNNYYGKRKGKTDDSWNKNNSDRHRKPGVEYRRDNMREKETYKKY